DGFSIEESYKLNAHIDAQILTKANEQTLNFLIPLAIEIYPKSNWNQVKANGRIEIELELTFDIFQNQFLTKSNVKSYHWLENPKLSVLGIRLPVEGIANKFLDKYKSELCMSIDQYFTSIIDLNKVKIALRKSFDSPFYTTEDGIIKVYSSPSEVALGPMTVEQDKIVFPAIIFLENVIANEKPTELYNDLSFSFRPRVEDFTKFAIQARIPMNYLELIVKENFENQSFGNGLTKLKITKISLSGEDHSVLVNLHSTGAYNGVIQVKFEPIFNQSKSEIQLEKFQMKAIEGKSMDKALFSLVKGIAENKVKKELENGLNNILKEYRLTLLPYLENKEIYPGVILSGGLQEWEIRDFNFVNQLMTFNVNTKLKAKLDIYKLDSKLLLGY
ncbi:MAG: DUF4403 family protein, partial [Saprospiraceae bacterium]